MENTTILIPSSTRRLTEIEFQLREEKALDRTGSWTVPDIIDIH